MNGWVDRPLGRTKVPSRVADHVLSTVVLNDSLTDSVLSDKSSSLLLNGLRCVSVQYFLIVYTF